VGEVRQLFRVNQFAPDAESQAAYLEQVAAQVRAGEIQIARAVLVYSEPSPSGQIQYLPFGGPMDGAAMVGLLEWAKVKMVLPEPE
jgi:hypothetical protein